MDSSISIRVGEQGSQFANRYRGTVRVQHQPAGLDFYKVDWDKPPHGTVKLEHGRHSLQFENVLSLSSSQDLGSLADEGLFEFDVNAGISAPDLISHDDARLRTYAVLKRILAAGWQQVIDRSEPRLRGKTRLDYMFATSSIHGLDATFVPSLEDWMRIESRTPWTFYAQGLYLTADFTRESRLRDPARPGSYLLSFNVKTETEYYRGFASPSQRSSWKQVLPAELKRAAEQRLVKEQSLRSRGVVIDESYKDPPFIEIAKLR